MFAKKMALIPAVFALAAAISTSAGAADCGTVLNDLDKAISGQLNLSTEKKVAFMRMSISSYDHCMAGDNSVF